MGRIRKQKKKPLSRKTGTQDEELDFETVVREEFKRLHRQYRLMEDARHAIAGASGKLSRQGRLLEALRAEKEDLLTDLKNANSRQNRAKDKQSIRTILEALERYEKYKLDIQACLMNIAEMEANVDRITQRLVEQRLKVLALYGSSMTVPQVERRKRILENRLYHVTTQFDTLVSQNRALKVEINMMLKLRGQFYRRMLAIKKLTAKIKQRMGEVVVESTAAYDQRDEWVTKINLLRERNDKDSKQHVLEIKEFQRVLHHDSKIHEFLAIKNKEREQMESAQQRLDRKNLVKITDLDALLKAYRKSFKVILRLADSKDIESLVTQYLEDEQKNYGVFKFLTDLNHEVNSLQEDIMKIKDEIEKLAKERKQTTEDQENTLKDLEKELETRQDAFDDISVVYDHADADIKGYGNILDDLFGLAGCDKEFVIGVLGNQYGMGIHNLPLILKVLEGRAIELIYERSINDVRKSVEVDGNPLPKKIVYWAPGQKPSPVGGPFRPQVHVTGRVDADQEEDENETKAWSERPIYFEEMRKYLHHDVQQAMQSPSSLALDELARQSTFDTDHNPRMSLVFPGHAPLVEGEEVKPSNIFPPQKDKDKDRAEAEARRAAKLDEEKDLLSEREERGESSQTLDADAAESAASTVATSEAPPEVTEEASGPGPEPPPAPEEAADEEAKAEPEQQSAEAEDGGEAEE